MSVVAAYIYKHGARARAVTRDSGLRHHPELGLVEADEAQLAWLREVANPAAVE